MTAAPFTRTASPPRRARAVLSLVAAAQPAIPAAAQPDAIPVIDFTHEPTFYGSEAVESVAFAPDGAALYVHSHVPTVNLWPNLVALWPELLGGFAALVTILFLIVLARIRRRRRKRGAPHCRRCNYDLTPQVRAAPERERSPFAWDAGTLCPECGTSLDVARPVRGRSTARRLAPALAIWLCIVLPYAAMLALALPRDGRAAAWFDLSSGWIAQRADSWPLAWLNPRTRDTDRVVAIDPATGAVLRRITTRSTVTHFGLTVTPDGSALFLARGSTGIDAVGTRSGRVLNSATLPGWPTVDVNRPAVIGFSPDGADAYVQWADRDRNLSGVVRWPWRDRAPSAPLVQAEGFTRDAGGRPSHWPRVFILRDHNSEAVTSGPRFLSIPNFMEAFPTQKFVVMLHDGSALRRSIDVRPMPDPMQFPAISADGSILFLMRAHAAFLQGVDLGSGETIGSLASPDRFGMGEVVRSPGGRYMVTAGSESLLVRDTTAKKWHARLMFPREMYGPKPQVSPDGRWVAAVCQGNRPGQSGRASFYFRVFIWDLGDHRLVETTDADPSETTDGED